MLLRQFRLRTNLPTQIKENTDFLRQKPRELTSAEANFEGSYVICQRRYYFKRYKLDVLKI